MRENRALLSDLAARLPDLPRWVETRGMLLSGRCALVGAPGPGPADFIVRGTDLGLFSVVGEADLGPLEAAVNRHRGKFVVCAPESVGRVEAALAGWNATLWMIHTLAAGLATFSPAARSVRVEMLSARDGALLEDVPNPLREELRAAVGVSHAAVSFAGDRPASFCYAIYETETLWDLAVETLEPWRGRGLARVCCEFLIDHMSRHGKEPVWGTLEENTASMRLAKGLGFRPVDQLAVFQRAQGA